MKKRTVISYLRNPHGLSDVELRDARLAAADYLEQELLRETTNTARLVPDRCPTCGRLNHFARAIRERGRE